MKRAIGILLFIPFVIICSVRGCRAIQFAQRCEGYLDNASHANQIATAAPELHIAVKYLEDHGMMTGYTSIIYRTQEDNIGFWYINLKTASDELDREHSKGLTTALEQSNVLMKLHETLKRGVPEGISIYPYNGRYCILTTTSMILALIGGIICMVELDMFP